jgi:hypothetical protein
LRYQRLAESHIGERFAKSRLLLGARRGFSLRLKPALLARQPAIAIPIVKLYLLAVLGMSVGRVRAFRLRHRGFSLALTHEAGDSCPLRAGPSGSLPAFEDDHNRFPCLERIPCVLYSVVRICRKTSLEK